MTREDQCAIADEMRRLPEKERNLRIVWGALAGKVVDARHLFAARRAHPAPDHYGDAA